METFFIEFVKILVPSIVVFITAYLILSSFLENQLKVKTLEVQQKQREDNIRHYQDSLPLRLQAYERLALYLERINPQNLIMRTQTQMADNAGLTVPEMQMILISNIRTEFEHNLTQQLYVSTEGWLLVKVVTEEIISVISSIAQQLPTDASATDLSRQVLEYFIQSDHPIPTQGALEKLKEEVRELFSAG